jgi:3-oxoacyl-[acyl-carrier protein] reductase
MRQVALITGASGGIGQAVARELARQGYAVCLHYFHHEPAALAEELRAAGTDAVTVQADIARRAAVEAAAARAEAALGPVTLLVNNAGIDHEGLFQDMDDALWDRCFAVNVTGARNAVCAVLPNMLRAKAGAIVNISSIWGLRGASCEVAYACTKAALIGMTRSLALELAPSGIRVNCVAPGCIDTDMVRRLGPETVELLIGQTPLGRLGTPEDVARAVAFLASEQSSFLTGQVLTADGGFTC